MKPQKDMHLEMGMVRSSIRMLIPPNRQKEVLDILWSVIAQFQSESSCISCRLYRGADEERAILIEELWASKEQMLRHIRSDVYRRVLLAVEMAEEFPEIRFDEISHTSGMETIEKALMTSINAEGD